MINRRSLWAEGLVASWYLKKFQLDIYDLLLRENFPFVEKSRRIGGTTITLAYVLEQLRLHPGWICKWNEPWKFQAREIVMPEIEQLQRDCPTKYRFKYVTTDSYYQGPNGSRIYLRGVNDDNGESARGPFAHIIVCDEYGTWKNPDYVVKDALLPQILSTNGQLIKVGSVPKDLDHAYHKDREIALRTGRLISKTILDAVPELYSYEQIMRICEEVGGPDSITWKREFLNQVLVDPTLAVIPEWTERNIIEDNYPRTEFFTPYVGGDSGADDLTAILFGYYDFRQNEKVIEKELILQSQTTADIIAQAKQIEKELWGDKQPKKRVYDAPKQLIHDIYVDHKWPVQMPQKDDRLAAIHDLRTEVGAARFKVKKSCKILCHQMRVGMWKDDRHSDFERTQGLGHLDAVAASIYFNRCIDTSFNPMSRTHGLNPETHFFPGIIKDNSTTDEQLANLLGGRFRKSR